MFSIFGSKKDKQDKPADLPEAALATEASAEPKRSWKDRLFGGLSATRNKLKANLASMFGGGVIDDSTYDELETALISADVGVEATADILDRLKKRVRSEGIVDKSGVAPALKASVLELLAPLERTLDFDRAKPLVILMCGVNGAGKTTSIGKLAKLFQIMHKRVLLAAGDTFRAAAREQLATWGERNGVDVIAQTGGDSAAVIFDAVSAAGARGIDIVLADTAGRLPTQLHLMEEIKKVKRVVQKADPSAPHEVWLVLDANTGQNAVQQVKAFHAALSLTGLIITKLDGTAKGGAIAAIAKQCPVPVVFLGVGETLDDLKPFKASEFVDAMFGD